MAIKKATVSVSIPEPEGEITIKTLEVEYKTDGQQVIDLELVYVPEGDGNGPVMRPRRPRR